MLEVFLPFLLKTRSSSNVILLLAMQEAFTSLPVSVFICFRTLSSSLAMHALSIGLKTAQMTTEEF